MKGYKYRIFPTNEQKIQIDKTIGCCRYIWNGFLALKKFRYKTFKENLGYNKMSSILTQVKHADDFLKKVDSTALQQTLKQLDNTYQMFFKKKCKYPKFKSKNNPKNSYKTTTCKIKDNKVLIPKVGLVDVAWSREIKGKILSATISKTPTEKYFISFCTDEITEHLPVSNKEIGIDLGLKTFAVCSDEQEFKAPKPIWKYIAKLKKLQRKLSKKKNKTSNRYKKLKLQIALLHKRIANIRKDFLHKLSTKLIQENQLICLEDLNVKGMTKNHKLARVILDCGFGMFIEMLKTKANMYGRQVVQIDRWYPSSKTCHKCGSIKKDLTLKDRIYICPECGEIIDRDLNAAINILTVGRQSIRG